MSKIERIDMHEHAVFVKELKVLVDHYSVIINDALNGCPGDFVEDFNRKRNALIIEHTARVGN